MSSQLAHDGFGRKTENWTCWEFIQTSWLQNCKLGHITTELTCSVFSFSTKSISSRRELDANSLHTARCQRDTTRQLSRVGGVYWAFKPSCRMEDKQSHTITRKLCYCKDDRAMHPIYGLWVPWKFLGLPDYAHGYFFQNFMGFCSDGTVRKSVGEFL